MATVKLTHDQHYENILNRLRELECDVGDIKLLEYLSHAIRRAEIVKKDPSKERTAR